MAKGKEIKALVADLIGERSKVKQLPDLVEALSDSETTRPAVNGIAKVFTHIIRRGDFKALGGENEDDPAVKYASWLLAVFDEAWAKMVALLSDESQKKSLKELTLSVLMKLATALHNEGKVTSKWSAQDQDRFNSVVDQLCSKTTDMTAIIDRFQEYVDYLDVKFYLIQSLARSLKNLTSGKKAAESKTSLAFRKNVLRILEILNFGDSSDDGPGLLCQEGFECPEESMNKNFNSIWESYLKLKAETNVDIYKRVLILLTDKVMPVLSKPLLLTDFLMESYSVGGSISLLALNGVFILINEHNLEYPDFYTKLYALCTPELLHAKYRARFFHLANMFLASTHLPEYLVAAFVKRFSRLALTGPSNSLLLILPFIGNLLLRHKSLAKMIDCEEDNYIMDEPDPSKCKAVDSGLWEIKTLQNHAMPQVAQAAKFINKSLPQMEWNLEDYLEIAQEDMFNIEARKKIFVNVPLTFERPVGCAFPKEDLTSKFFDI